MGSLQIRELPADVYDALARRAGLEGRSLAQQAIAELRRVTAGAGRGRRLATIELLRSELAERPDAVLTVDPVDLIREDRER